MDDQNLMDPKEYRKIIHQMELLSIVLDSCAVKTKRGNLGDENIKLHIDHKYSYDKNDDTSEIFSIYSLVATKSSKRDFALKIECTYKVIISGEEISDAFLNTYCKFNLSVNTWPFFREFVQSMVNRTGFPPLTLPLLKPSN